MKKQLLEGLDYHDMKGQVAPKITVDEYAAKTGKDSDVVTITFKTNSKLAADDLTSWLEMGYDYIIDASVSTGEVESGKYLVFAELNRRRNVPERIIDILEDLNTLTDIPVDKWTVDVEGEEYPADVDKLKEVIITSPHEYRERKEHEKELNNLREIAGLQTTKMHQDDDYIKGIKELAGI